MTLYEQENGKPKSKEERERMNKDVGKPLRISGGKSVK